MFVELSDDEDVAGTSRKRKAPRNKKSGPYKQAYRKAWEEDPTFKGWLAKSPYDNVKAYCRLCEKPLVPHRLSLIKHMVSIRHTRLSQSLAEVENEAAADQESVLSDYIVIKVEDETEVCEPEDRPNGSKSPIELNHSTRSSPAHTQHTPSQSPHGSPTGTLNHSASPSPSGSHNRSTSQSPCPSPHYSASQSPPPPSHHSISHSPAPSPQHSVSTSPSPPSHCSASRSPPHHSAHQSSSVTSNRSPTQPLPPLPQLSGSSHPSNHQNILQSPPSSFHRSTSGSSHHSSRLSASHTPQGSPHHSASQSPPVSPHHSPSHSPPGSPHRSASQSPPRVPHRAGSQSPPRVPRPPSFHPPYRLPVLSPPCPVPFSPSQSQPPSPPFSEINSYSNFIVRPSYPVYSDFNGTVNRPSKPPITTHVLDMTMGLPATGLCVSLSTFVDGKWTLIKQSLTNADGRCDSLMTPGMIRPGRYKLHFETEHYFMSRQQHTFYPFVEVVFDVCSSTDIHHVPLLLSPFGYSTYRGS